MKTDFKSKLELVRYYSDEENCKKLLAQQRWGNSPACPHCGNAGKIYTTNRGYKCGEPTCHKKFTVITKTIFENTKIPLNKWFEAIFVISAHKKGISSHQLGRDIAVSQKTAWFILHRVREMLADNAPELLDGMVEADETYVGGKVSNQHKKKREKSDKKFSPLSGKTPVFGLLERGGKVYNQVIPQPNRPIVSNMVLANVATTAKLVTDASSLYPQLAGTYEHHVVNHHQGEYVRGFVYTNGIENYWSHLKRGINGIYHHVAPKHLHRYCNEFSYRFNTRKIKDVDRFTIVLARCEGRLKWTQLVAKPD